MATEPHHFSETPIIEAVINIQVSPLPETALESFKNLLKRVQADYPLQQELSQMEFTGQISPEGPKTSARQRPIGLQFQSTDIKQVFQVRLNGFSFHRLAPYGEWQSFRGEASRLWSLYRAVAGPTRIETYSIRYINKIPVPLGQPIERYLKVYPVIPVDLPQVMSNYVMRLELQIDRGIWIMHQALLPPEMPGRGFVLLDNELRYSGLGLTDEDVWGRIDETRHEKNRIFLGCITEELKGILS
jgi:uncharacterized protein (TIGR04255 family)